MPNCFGNEVESGCIVYGGPDLAVIGVKNGDSLDAVLSKIASYQAPILPNKSVSTTDDIVTTSLIRSTGSLCASNIINRELQYSLSTNAAGTVLTYDMVNIVRSLPNDYELSIGRVRVLGIPVGGISVVTDSRSLGTSLSIPLNRYPVTAEFLLRITSPCGQIDLTKTIDLNNPALVGSFRVDLDGQDLTPNQGQVNLTQQLNNVEARLNAVEGRVKDAVATKPELETQSSAITDVETKVDNPDSFVINYVKDSSITSAQLTEIVTNLHSDIKALNEKVRSQQNTITTLTNQVNSL